MKLVSDRRRAGVTFRRFDDKGVSGSDRYHMHIPYDGEEVEGTDGHTDTKRFTTSVGKLLSIHVRVFRYFLIAMSASETAACQSLRVVQCYTRLTK
jgi:hypothetical protein